MLECPRVEVIFKIRADQDKPPQLEEYGLLDIAERITVICSIRDAKSRIDAAVGTYSTFLYNTVAFGIPTAIIETSLDYGMGMVENGLAALLKKDGNVCDELERLSKVSTSELEARKRKLVGEEGRKLVSTLRDIIKVHA